MKSLCVFCGSGMGTKESHRQAARALGEAMAARGMDLVYGGASVGLMGIVANACLSGGGRVIGVMPQGLVDLEVAHDHLSEFHVVDSMHERKLLMGELSDGYAALPGGIGTLDELFEVFTWLQLGIQVKPIGILNVDGFYDPLLDLLARMVENKYLAAPHKDMLQVDPDPLALLDGLQNARPVYLEKWFDLKANKAPAAG